MNEIVDDLQFNLVITDIIVSVCGNCNVVISVIYSFLMGGFQYSTLL